jgi:hypothetical protein
MSERVMRDGETCRLDCTSCNREFLLVLEPKCKGTDQEGEGRASKVRVCPFCGSDELEGDDV